MNNDVSGSNGFIIDGVMKDIANSAIKIMNIDNEQYAINAANGLWIDKGGISYSNRGVKSGKIVSKGSNGQAI